MMTMSSFRNPLKEFLRSEVDHFFELNNCSDLDREGLKSLLCVLLYCLFYRRDSTTKWLPNLRSWMSFSQTVLHAFQRILSFSLFWISDRPFSVLCVEFVVPISLSIQIPSFQLTRQRVNTWLGFHVAATFRTPNPKDLHYNDYNCIQFKRGSIQRGVGPRLVYDKQQKVLFGFTYTKRYGELSPVWCSVLCLV